MEIVSGRELLVLGFRGGIICRNVGRWRKTHGAAGSDDAVATPEVEEEEWSASPILREQVRRLVFSTPWNGGLNSHL